MQKQMWCMCPSSSGQNDFLYWITQWEKRVSQVARWRIFLPTQETWVWSLGWEDPLEEEIATNSSILAWKIPWTEEPGGLQSMGSWRVGHDWVAEHWALSERKIKETFIVWRNEWKKKYLVTFYFLFPFRHCNHRLRKRSKTVWKNRG